MTDQNELSDREIEILKLVATGASNKEIAYKLSISPNTVKVHLKNIFAKIGVMSRTEAAMYAVKRGWVGERTEIFTEKEIINVNGKVTNLMPVIKETYFPILFVTLLLVIVFLYQAVSTVQSVVKGQKFFNNSTTSPESWDNITSLPQPKRYMACQLIDNYLYIIGGESQDGISASVNAYDIISATWYELPSKPTPASEIGAVYLGGKIYVPGGRTRDGRLIRNLDIYNIEQAMWEKGAELPETLSRYALTSFEGKIYILGGWNGYLNSSKIYIYDPNTNSWKYNVLGANGGVSLATAGIIENKIYLIGGYSDDRPINTLQLLKPPFISKDGVEIFDVITLPNGIYDMASVTVLDKIYILGGRTDFGYQNNSMEVNLQTREISTLENPLKNEWSSLCAVQYGDYILGIGGQLGNKLNAAIYRYKVVYTVTLPVIH